MAEAQPVGAARAGAGVVAEMAAARLAAARREVAAVGAAG